MKIREQVFQFITLSFCLILLSACNTGADEVAQLQVFGDNVIADHPADSDGLTPEGLFPEEEREEEEIDEAVVGKCQVLKIREMHLEGLLFIDQVANEEKVAFLAYEYAQPLNAKISVKSLATGNIARRLASGLGGLRLSKQMVEVASRCPAFKAKFCAYSADELRVLGSRHLTASSELRVLSKARPFSQREYIVKALHKRICLKSAAPQGEAVASAN